MNAALGIGREQFGRWEPHSPDLIWPKDRSWFVSTDVDYWFACIGGPSGLVEDLVNDQRLTGGLLTPEDPLLRADEAT